MLLKRYYLPTSSSQQSQVLSFIPDPEFVCFLHVCVGLCFRRLEKTSTRWRMWWRRSETKPPGRVCPFCRTSSNLKSRILNTSDWVKKQQQQTNTHMGLNSMTQLYICWKLFKYLSFSEFVMFEAQFISVDVSSVIVFASCLKKVWCFVVVVSFLSDRVLQENRRLPESVGHRHQSFGSDLSAGGWKRGVTTPEERTRSQGIWEDFILYSSSFLMTLLGGITSCFFVIKSIFLLQEKL